MASPGRTRKGRIIYLPGSWPRISWLVTGVADGFVARVTSVAGEGPGLPRIVSRVAPLG